MGEPLGQFGLPEEGGLRHRHDLMRYYRFRERKRPRTREGSRPGGSSGQMVLVRVRGRSTHAPASLEDNWQSGEASRAVRGRHPDTGQPGPRDDASAPARSNSPLVQHPRRLPGHDRADGRQRGSLRRWIRRASDTSLWMTGDGGEEGSRVHHEPPWARLTSLTSQHAQVRSRDDSASRRPTTPTQCRECIPGLPRSCKVSWIARAPNEKAPDPCGIRGLGNCSQGDQGA